VVFPPLEEQVKIAQILSTWDEALENLNALLEQKRRLKKGLMQQLLTGRVRFKEFEARGEAWAEVKLGEITRIKTGARDNVHKIENGRYPFFVRSDKIERIDSYSFDGEAILIPGEGRIGEIIHYVKGRFDYHQRVYKISNFFEGRVIGKYCYYYLQKFFKAATIKGSVKATVDSLRLPTFTQMEMFLPPLEEQRKIAFVLSTLDQEISTLEAEKAALGVQKRGLMGLLLTGKVRVQVGETADALGPKFAALEGEEEDIEVREAFWLEVDEGMAAGPLED